MPPKSARTSVAPDKIIDESSFDYVPPRTVHVGITLTGESPTNEDFLLLVVFQGHIVSDGKWVDGICWVNQILPLNLKNANDQNAIVDNPLVFVLRAVGGKGSKEADPLMHVDNRAGGTFDLLPLLFGYEELCHCVTLVDIQTGENTSFEIEVKATTSLPQEEPIGKIPLIVTFLSIHCLPAVKDGTFYIGAVGLDGIIDSRAVNFGVSISTAEATKLVWASANTAGFGANSAFNIPNDDKFIPEDFTIENTKDCRNFYWNSFKRVFVNPLDLFQRLQLPILVEVAGVPRAGKIDVRGRYLGFLDARPLLEPEQTGFTACVQLKMFSELMLPPETGPLLEIPPSSGKATARDATDIILDEFGHTTYMLLRFDVFEALVPKPKMVTLYEMIGFAPPEGRLYTVPELEIPPPPEDPVIDVRKIRKERGALAVHKELSGLACRGAVPMTQGIKRTVANRLLMRIRAMLKQFPPGECSYIEWQDTVTGQHAACRRAVTASFAPQPPQLRLPPKSAAARCRMAGDTRVSDIYLETNLKIDDKHPRCLLSKSLRCLEARSDVEAKTYITEGLTSQPRNRYLLWMFGGQEIEKGIEAAEMAAAAFRIAVKGDYSDGVSLTIGWGALHVIQHYMNRMPAAFVAAKRMRKAFDLQGDWNKFIKKWVEASGEEEVYWVPKVISQNDPLILTAAFFLCLRCYKFCEMTLRCVEKDCGYKGNRFDLKSKPSVDIYYLRASSLIMRRQYDLALEMTMKGVKRFGPSPKMTQLHLMCLTCMRDWDDECEYAFKEAEKAGSLLCPYILLKAANGLMKYDYEAALQRAARAHKYAPSAYTALAIARAYALMNDRVIAERWAAAAVKVEPLLSDGWAFLAILAMYERRVDKALALLRTAYQVGPISADIEDDVNELLDELQINPLPEALVKNLCYCEYY